MKRLIITSSALLLVTSLLSGCGDTAEAPVADVSVTETVPQVEAKALMVEAGPVTAAVVIEESTPESSTVFYASTEVQALTAKVVSVDLETRDVVLLGEDGVELSLVASDKTHNLEQVSPGDTVNAKFMERVTIELVKGDDMQAYEVSSDREVQADEGEMPARAEVMQTVNVYTVEAIDTEANTFKLKNVEGQVKEFTARDPANLAKATVGDAVV
ncbi:MAG: hypothetical protein KAG70_13090, partial [Alcanivorax sp.]|nr:hypothetical protein [Alcanivorax sp.]